MHSAIWEFTLLAIAALLAFGSVNSTYAQTSNGTVMGAVTDTTGGAVVAARVIITSVDTGAIREISTDQDGAFRIESVAPGTYNVSVSAAGYETVIHKGLIVPGTSITTANVQLRVGQTTEVVEVSADNATLNTDNGQVAGTINEVEINNLPVGSLSPYELALTLPGVTNTMQGSFSNGVAFEVGGGRPRSNNFLIEGQDNNDAGIGGQGLQPENLDAVSEVRVLQNNYTAEFGHGAGSVSNLIFKSGTNEFHGAIYERAENSSLDTVDKQDHFNDSTPTKYRENLPGFRIGGPIIRNKLFGFGSYQWDFYRASANLDVLSIPTAAGMATLKALPSNPRLTNLLAAYGNLVGTLNPNNLKPSIALGPNPTTGVDRGTVEVGTYQRNLGAQSNGPEMDLTADYIPNKKDVLRFRLIRTSYTAPVDVWNEPSQLPGFDSDQEGSAYNAGVVETHVFNANVVNEARLSYGRIGFTFGLPASTTSNPLYNQPALTVSNLQGYGIPGSMPQGRFHNTYQLQDTISWNKGKHFVKAGADVSSVRVRDQIPFNYYGSISFGDDTSSTPVTGGTSFVYKGLGNLLDNFGGPSTNAVAQNFGSPTARPMIYYQSYFVEDTYRPVQSLSVDMGLRYEYNGAPFNTPATPHPGLDPANIGCYPSAGVICNDKQKSDGNMWGPRLGLAYTPEVFGARKTVIRAGFGVFYDWLFTNIIDNIQANAPAAASPVIYSSTAANGNRGTASWYEQFANLNKTPLASNTANPIKYNLLSPLTMHWNLDVEQEIPWATTVQVSYVGERGEHLFGQTQVNPFVNNWFSSSRVSPTRGSVVERDNSGDSEYSGLWAQLDHKINHNFLFRASYTWAKSLDDVSEIFTPLGTNESSYQFSRYPTPRRTTDWGSSMYDARQRLALSYTWAPPVWHTEGGMQVVGNAVNHWVIAGVTQFQSGSPLNVETGYDVDGDGIANDRPIIGNAKAPLTTYAFDDSWYTGGPSGGTLCSGPSLWYTYLPCETVSSSAVHWIVPETGTHPSNAVSRNSLFGPSFQQWDMNISRQFKVYENVTLDLRGEFFNIFNHGNANAENEGGTMNTTLISGINTDQWSNYGTNTFNDPAPTEYGHRHVRLVLKFSF
jgi:hypothetical protein